MSINMSLYENIPVLIHDSWWIVILKLCKNVFVNLQKCFYSIEKFNKDKWCY